MTWSPSHILWTGYEPSMTLTFMPLGAGVRVRARAWNHGSNRSIYSVGLAQARPKYVISNYTSRIFVINRPISYTAWCNRPKCFFLCALDRRYGLSESQCSSAAIGRPISCTLDAIDRLINAEIAIYRFPAPIECKSDIKAFVRTILIYLAVYRSTYYSRLQICISAGTVNSASQPRQQYILVSGSCSE